MVNSSALAKFDVLNGSACKAKLRLAGVAAKSVQGRCGYGMRQPFLVISPYARVNHVDHTLTDQTSVDRFIEDNWLGGKRIGHGSFDRIAGSLRGMFNFSKGKTPKLILDPATGEPQ